MNQNLKPPPEMSLLIFAGSADITERNLRRQLTHWLPADLRIDRPVIQEEIPDEYEGLLNVRTWLSDEFAGSFDEVPDLPSFIDTLKETEDVYLIMLWGRNGGDEPTEKLVDMAERRGIKVLDLADGLETLELGHRAPPENKTEAEPEARPRRRRAAAAVREDAEVPQDTPVAAPQDAHSQPRASDTDRVLAGLLGMAFQAAADVFLAYFSATPATRPGDEPADVRDTEEIPREPAEETRGWYRNPNNQSEYEIKKPRGRKPIAVKDWEVVFLTRAQEQELGLKVPGER